MREGECERACPEVEPDCWLRLALGAVTKVVGMQDRQAPQWREPQSQQWGWTGQRASGKGPGFPRFHGGVWEGQAPSDPLAGRTPGAPFPCAPRAQRRWGARAGEGLGGQARAQEGGWPSWHSVGCAPETPRHSAVQQGQLGLLTPNQTQPCFLFRPAAPGGGE